MNKSIEQKRIKKLKSTDDKLYDYSEEIPKKDKNSIDIIPIIKKKNEY